MFFLKSGIIFCSLILFQILKKILAILWSISLYCISWALKKILSPILFVWGLIGSAKRKETKIYFRELSLANDRYGNVLGKYTFNDVLGDGFGNGKETISSRLGKNEMFGSLKVIGPTTAKTLNWLDKEHCKKSIDFVI